VPGSWARFVIAHARWILLVTCAAVGGAALLAHSQTPRYTSETEVYVGFSAAEGGTLQAPDMATEKGVVSSGVVLAKAARALGVPQSQLLQGVSANVPAGTFLLQIFYSDPSPQIAQQRAQAVANAYVSYRTYRPVPAKAGAKAPVVGSSSPTPTAALLTSASLPKAPSSPDYKIDLIAALIVGLALGLGTAGIRDHLDDRLRGPRELEVLASAPVLALIPSFWSSPRHPVRRLAVVASPDSVVADAYRNLRTQLVQAAFCRDRRTLLITSVAWEDKSTVAANLAASLAQAGHYTILVCCDVRWGSACELFGLTGTTTGLTSVLERSADLATALQATSFGRLKVLPPGPLPPDPSAVLQRPSLRTVVGELRAHADFVIIEAPPLLATPEAGLLGDPAEMILLVADARRSTRAQLTAAVRELQSVENKVVGWVLDNVGRRCRLREPSGPLEAFDEPLAGGWPDLGATGDRHEPGRPDRGRQRVNQTAQPTAAAGQMLKSTGEEGP
jgi:capsular exopolysaccharide synthesis family protein